MTVTDQLPATQQAEPDEIPFLDVVQEIVGRIDYREGYRFEVAIDKKDPKGRVYFQLWHTRPDADTGEVGEGRGGKRYLSPHMTDTEIVHAVLGACLAYEEHEVREFFRYKPTDDAALRAVFGPHIDVNQMWRVADVLDVRP